MLAEAESSGFDVVASDADDEDDDLAIEDLSSTGGAGAGAAATARKVRPDERLPGESIADAKRRWDKWKTDQMQVDSEDELEPVIHDISNNEAGSSNGGGTVPFGQRGASSSSSSDIVYSDGTRAPRVAPTIDATPFSDKRPGKKPIDYSNNSEGASTGVTFDAEAREKALKARKDAAAARKAAAAAEDNELDSISTTSEQRLAVMRAERKAREAKAAAKAEAKAAAKAAKAAAAAVAAPVEAAAVAADPAPKLSATRLKNHYRHCPIYQT